MDAQVRKFCYVIFVSSVSFTFHFSAVFSSCFLCSIPIRRVERFPLWKTNEPVLRREMRWIGPQSFTVLPFQVWSSRWFTEQYGGHIAASSHHRDWGAPLSSFCTPFPFLYNRGSSFSVMITNSVRLHCWLHSSSYHTPPSRPTRPFILHSGSLFPLFPSVCPSCLLYILLMSAT